MTLFGFIEVASIICAFVAGGACVMDWRKRHIDGSNASTAENFRTSGMGDNGVTSETCIEVGTSLRAEDEPCLDPERCRRLDYCLRDPSDERYPGTIEPCE